jgi:acyl-CoA hydrolase
MSAPQTAEEAVDLATWVQPGDGIVVGQCCAEPSVLVRALADQGPGLGGVRLFLGMTFADTFAEPVDGVDISSYGGLGRTGRIPGLRIVPCHFSALPRLFAEGALPGDVALIQVAPPDEDGNCSLGVGVDYLADALVHARVIIAEVNDRVPRTCGPSVPYERINHAVHTSRELVEAPPAAPGDTERAIAENVAALVRDGDTVQLGVGALPEAILHALRDRRELRFHSGMISDGVLDLIELGAVTATVTGAALGSTRLLDALHEHPGVRFAPVSHTHAQAVLADVGPLIAINSAIEIDLAGNANGEAVGGRAIGAVGGQVDFLRAAAANGGKGILALPARRIVARLNGPVTTAHADVDWVVTEHGARSLRGRSDADRERALREIGGGAS